MHQPTQHHCNRPSISDPLVVAYILDNDVLCGRDKHATTHPGNRRFRSIIQSNCERYQMAQKRSEKSQISVEVISAVHEAGGRFLRFDEDLACWVEVQKEDVKDKISHALRSARVPKRTPGRSTMTPEDEVEEAFKQVFKVQQESYHKLLDDTCAKGAGDGTSNAN